MTALMRFEDIPLDKPSMLIRVALADLAKVEAMPEIYKVEMHFFHRPFDDELCHVCLAGAVMAMSLNVSPDLNYMPSEADNEAARKLLALDCFRMGRVPNALYELGISTGVGRYREITPYRKDPALFRRDMERLASDLEEAGL